MPRVTLSITEDERQALVLRARDERRDPRAQAAIELRRALEWAGYLDQPTIKAAPLGSLARPAVGSQPAQPPVMR